MKKLLLPLMIFAGISSLHADQLLVPMDAAQNNQLKAYGAVYAALQQHQPVQWLLNYRGGSYLMNDAEATRALLEKQGIRFEAMNDLEAKTLTDRIGDDAMQSVVQLQRAPKVAVYAPSDKSEQWDDAVMNTLDYAGIPYKVLNDFDVLNADLSQYDWIHLHHEDFTGQYGRYGYAYNRAQWYKDMVASEEAEATKLGYAKVSQMKLAVAKRLKQYIADGGYLFAMCSATDSYDIALAAEGVDIVPAEFDGDAMDAKAESKLNYANCLAFQNFTISNDPTEYEFSNIDTYNNRSRFLHWDNDKFTLESYSGKTNPELAMLTQNDSRTVKGFWGMTAGFNTNLVKSGVSIMAGNTDANEARYITGNYGKGAWCFYSGHDPEAYQHRVGDKAPDLSKTPSSPGCRLILNNALRPAALVSNSPLTEAMDVKIWPTVISQDNTISYSIALQEQSTVEVRMLNGLGQQVQRFELGMLNEGNTVSTLQLPALSGGVYYMEVQAGQTVQRKKFVVQ